MSASTVAARGGHDALDALARALEPLEPVAGHELDAVRRAAARAKKAPAVGPKCAESGASSSITIVQRLPSVVSVAATSQAM